MKKKEKKFQIFNKNISKTELFLKNTYFNLFFFKKEITKI